jgi:hypothetical protein
MAEDMNGDKKLINIDAHLYKSENPKRNGRMHNNYSSLQAQNMRRSID